MRYLVTGGAGYIGSNLVDDLIERDDEVWILDDLSTGKRENIAHHFGKPNFRFVEGSILDEPLVDELITDSDAVFHLAARLTVKWVHEHPLDALKVNVRGTEVVLQHCTRHEKRVVVASSSEVYGISDERPFSEDGPRVLGPTNIPRWSYATAKALDEHLAFGFAMENGLRFSAVRYFNSYGPRIDEEGYGSVIARFIQRAFRNEPLEIYGDGTQVRAFSYIDDTVNGTIAAMENDAAVGEVFNIGSTFAVTINELAEKVRGLAGSKSEIVHVSYEDVFGPNFSDIPHRVPDTSKAKELLGFEAKVDLDLGLKRTIEWARAHYASAENTE
jgi:UDP-glucose 4-epimerase